MPDKKVRSGSKQTFVFLGFILMLLFISSRVFSATPCSPTSVQLCVAADDIAHVWINSHDAGQFTYVNWDQTGIYPPCISIDPTWITETGNIISIDVKNTACCEIWGSWTIESMCADGSHSCLSSDDTGMMLYNVPIPSDIPPPKDTNGTDWWALTYTAVAVPTWEPAVVDTGTIYGKLIYNPCTGKELQPLSYDTGGSGTIPGNHIYMRQPFSMNPVPTLPPANFTISKSIVGAPLNDVNTGDRVTYQLLVCNSGGAVADSSVLLTDDYDNGFSFDGPYGGDCAGNGDGSPCSQNGTGIFTTRWMRGFPGMTCVTVTGKVVDYYVDGSEYCQYRSNWAGVHWTGAASDAKSNTVSVRMICPGTPTYTKTITPTFTISSTTTFSPTQTATSTRTSMPTLTRTLSFTVSPTFSQTWTVSQTWTPHTGMSNTNTPTITITWTKTITLTWTLTPTPTYTPSVTVTPTSTITNTWVNAINIVKSEDKTQVPMGDTVQYCITFTNVGANPATFDLWDTIPDVTTFLWCTEGCTAPSSGREGNTYVVKWHLTNVPAGASGMVCMWVQLERWPFYRPERLKEYFAGLKNRLMAYFRNGDYTLETARNRGTP